MYKSDIVEALSRLQVSNGGPIAGLLERVVAARSNVDAAEAEIAANNEASLKAGCKHLNEALLPLGERLNEISPSGTAIELHQTGQTFDRVLSDYPALESLIRPARQALAELAGAFDVALQRNRRPPTLIGLITPGVLLAAHFEHFSALVRTLSESNGQPETEVTSVIEIDGVEGLVVFSDFLSLLATLSRAATSSLGQVSNGPETAQKDDVTIVSIESGSPIRITLGGKGKTLRFLLAMLRDVIRLPYLHLSSRGQVVQAIETYAYAKSMGVESQEVLVNLEEAMVKASQRYAERLSPKVTLTIDGRRESNAQPPLLPAPFDAGEDSKSGTLNLPEP